MGRVEGENGCKEAVVEGREGLKERAGVCVCVCVCMCVSVCEGRESWRGRAGETNA